MIKSHDKFSPQTPCWISHSQHRLKQLGPPLGENFETTTTQHRADKIELMHHRTHIADQLIYHPNRWHPDDKETKRRGRWWPVSDLHRTDAVIGDARIGPREHVQSALSIIFIGKRLADLSVRQIICNGLGPTRGRVSESTAARCYDADHIAFCEPVHAF